MIEFEKVKGLEGLYRIGRTFSGVQSVVVFDEEDPGNKKFIENVRSYRDYGSFLDDSDFWNARGIGGWSIGERYVREAGRKMNSYVGLMALFTGALLTLGKFSELDSSGKFLFGAGSFLDLMGLIGFFGAGYGKSVVNRFVRGDV